MGTVTRRTDMEIISVAIAGGLYTSSRSSLLDMSAFLFCSLVADGSEARRILNEANNLATCKDLIQYYPTESTLFRVYSQTHTHAQTNKKFAEMINALAYSLDSKELREILEEEGIMRMLLFIH